MAAGKTSSKKKGKCPKSGCIKKVGSDWRVVRNKTGKLWPAKYKSKNTKRVHDLLCTRFVFLGL